MSFTYFDYNATTPVAPEVLEAMLPYLTEHYGNASSLHDAGRAARRAVDRAREQVATALGAQPAQVVFTAGGTESSNLAVKGLAGVVATKRLVVSSLEHACVRVPAHELSWADWQVRWLKADADGRTDLADVAAALREPAGIVAVMVANNETGVIQDVPAISAAAHAAGALMHADAVQAFGKIPVDFKALGADTLGIAGHKIYAPKGIGALILGEHVDLMPLITGGSHERGLRAGTENVPAIVGLGKACELAAARVESEGRRLAGLRDELEAALLRAGAVIFGRAAPRVPNTCYFAIPGVHGPSLAEALDAAGFGVATGSACSAGKKDKLSEVLTAMRVPETLARGAIRVSFGKDTTAESVARLGAAIATAARRLAAAS